MPAELLSEETEAPRSKGRDSPSGWREPLQASSCSESRGARMETNEKPKKRLDSGGEARVGLCRAW